MSAEFAPRIGRCTMRQATRTLGVESRIIRRWVRRGVLPGQLRPGGVVRLHQDDVANFSDTRSSDAVGRLNRVDDHLCFGCGRLNPLGLHLAFYAEEDGVRTEFTPGRLREGWAGATHGGIVAVLLDEVMAWSLFHLDVLAVTTRIAITYRRPAPIGAPLVARARITRDRGRLIDVAGDVRDSAGQVIAEAVGSFMRVNDERRMRLERAYGLRKSD